MKYNKLFIPLISVLFLTLASCSDDYRTCEGQTWGTSYHIVYKSQEPLDSTIVAIMRNIDAELSMFNPSSTVSAINSGERTAATPAFRKVFDIAQQVADLSHGVYDPTVAPLTDLWGFGRADTGAAPADSAITSALATVGIADCYIDSLGRVCKKHPATAFDFSSIAKGYGIDCIGKAMNEAGIDNYMIEIGGEILCKGVNRKGRKWRIQIDAPSSEPVHKRLDLVELGPEQTALASSGNYRNYRADADGHIYGHTLSPVIGRPVEGYVLAATVRHTDCATADALATACMASAVPDSAVAILKRAKAAGIIVYASADSLAVVRTNM